MSSQLEQNITAELVGKLAKVVGQEMEPNGIEAMTRRYLGFLQEIERLRELDVSKYEPATVFQVY